MGKHHQLEADQPDEFLVRAQDDYSAEEFTIYSSLDQLAMAKFLATSKSLIKVK